MDKAKYEAGIKRISEMLRNEDISLEQARAYGTQLKSKYEPSIGDKLIEGAKDVGGKALDYGLRGLDYAGGLSRVGAANLAELLPGTPTEIATDEDLINAFKGKAPMSEDMLERAGVGEMGSANIPLLGAAASGVKGLFSDTPMTPEDQAEWSKITGRGALGTAMDVGLDPATYLTMGGSAAGKLGLAKTAGMLSKGAKVADAPMRLLAKGAGKATQPFGKMMYKAAVRPMLEHAGKFKKPMNEAFDTIHRNRIKGNYAGMKEGANDAIESIGDNITDMMAKAQAKGAKIDVDEMFQGTHARIDGILKNPGQYTKQQLDQAAAFKEELVRLGDANRAIPEQWVKERPMGQASLLPEGEITPKFETTSQLVTEMDKPLLGRASPEGLLPSGERTPMFSQRTQAVGDFSSPLQGKVQGDQLSFLPSGEATPNMSEQLSLLGEKTTGPGTYIAPDPYATLMQPAGHGPAPKTIHGSTPVSTPSAQQTSMFSDIQSKGVPSQVGSETITSSKPIAQQTDMLTDVQSVKAGSPEAYVETGTRSAPIAEQTTLLHSQPSTKPLLQQGKEGINLVGAKHLKTNLRKTLKSNAYKDLSESSIGPDLVKQVTADMANYGTKAISSVDQELGAKYAQAMADQGNLLTMRKTFENEATKEATRQARHGISAVDAGLFGFGMNTGGAGYLPLLTKKTVEGIRTPQFRTGLGSYLATPMKTGLESSLLKTPLKQQYYTPANQEGQQ